MIIGTPLAGNASLPMKFFRSLLAVKEYDWIDQQGPNIAVNRNEIFERARVEGQDLLFVDSDMVFTREDVKRMEKHLKTMDVVTGLCVMSFQGNPPSLFKKNKTSFAPIFEFDKEHLFEIDACGGAFLGISNKVLNTLTEPFTPIDEPIYGQYFGEDISFCMRTKENGFKIWCDPTISIGHIKNDIKYYGRK